MFFNDRRWLRTGLRTRVKAVGLGSVLIGSMGLLGCTVTTTTSGPSDGTVVIDWTIEGSNASSFCNATSSAEIAVDVFNSAGAPFVSATEACDAFSILIPLPPGSYTAQATLLDSSGADRTTTIDINPFSISSNTEFDISIDYPTSSFR